MTVSEARKRRHDANAEMAQRAFAEHQIEIILANDMHRHWRCAKPGTGVYEFHVITVPGRLIVTGDIGFLAVERTRDMVAWCSGAVQSIEYFAEKVPRSIKTTEYSEEVAEAWCREELADEDVSDETKAELDDFIETVDFTNWHQFYTELHASEELSGHVANCDYPSFEDYNHNFLWCRQALMWFLASLPSLTADR